LYDQLMAVTPTPVVALNRAVALAEIRGAEEALSAIERLDLDDYYLFHAVRADLLSRIGRNDDARRAYANAITLTANSAERAFLERARKALPA
jgi:RNA polymerase sigma-70 factor (ECF subfamily)